MKAMRGLDAMFEIFKDEGIRYVFGNPGTTELPFMDGLVNHPELNYVLGLQEATAMAMADGYGRASGKLSVTNFHVAPGLGNAMGAIYNAKFFGSPVIVTAGQREHGLGITEPTLHGPLVEMAQPVTKWSVEIERTEDVPLVFRRAAKVALTPPTGPVFVSLPADVLLGSAELELGAPTRTLANTRPADEDVARLADRLLAAQNPVLVSAHEVYTEAAFAEVAQVAELLGAAVYSQTVPSLALFPTDHPLYLGELGKAALPVRRMLEPFDLVFMVGGDGLKTNTFLPGGPLPTGMPVLQISRHPWELGKNFPVEMALLAGTKLTLQALIPVLRARRSEAQAQAAARRTEATRTKNWSVRREELFAKAEQTAGDKPIKADYLMMQLSKELPEDAVVVEEALTSTRNLLKMLPAKHHQRFFGLASGGIGWGLAGAIGVKLALPERPVVAVIGDGSSMYSNQALWTAAHLKLPVTFVICNNKAYSILKERVIAQPNSASLANEKIIGMDFKDPELDFPALARGMGVPGHTITDPADIVPALRQALAADGPTLLDVHVHDGYRG